MSYNRTNWVDDETIANAEKFNNMEKAIESLHSCFLEGTEDNPVVFSDFDFENPKVYYVTGYYYYRSPSFTHYSDDIRKYHTDGSFFICSIDKIYDQRKVTKIDESIITYSIDTSILSSAPTVMLADISASQLNGISGDGYAKAGLLDTLGGDDFPTYGQGVLSVYTDEITGTREYYGLTYICDSISHYSYTAVSVSTGKVYVKTSETITWNEITPLIPVLSEDPKSPSEGQMWILVD